MTIQEIRQTSSLPPVPPPSAPAARGQDNDRTRKDQRATREDTRRSVGASGRGRGGVQRGDAPARDAGAVSRPQSKDPSKMGLSKAAENVTLGPQSSGRFGGLQAVPAADKSSANTRPTNRFDTLNETRSAEEIVKDLVKTEEVEEATAGVKQLSASDRMNIVTQIFQHMPDWHVKDIDRTLAWLNSLVCDKIITESNLTDG